MITKDMIKEALEKGVAKLTAIDGGETVCQIGEYWFYFGGTTAEEVGPDDYINVVGLDDTAREIAEAIDGLWETEQAYYRAVLSEAGIAA